MWCCWRATAARGVEGHAVDGAAVTFNVFGDCLRRTDCSRDAIACRQGLQFGLGGGGDRGELDGR